jgi:hypothetical protein
MRNLRFAYSSPLQAGERHTVRHTIGTHRNGGASASGGIGRGDIRHKATTNYAF